MPYYFTKADIAAAYQAASKADKEQMRDYIEANTKPLKDGRNNPGLSGIFRLLDYRNLDNGKGHTGASFGFDGQGLSPNEARALVGLPPLKGGDCGPSNRSERPSRVKTTPPPSKQSPEPVQEGCGVKVRRPLSAGGKQIRKKP